MNFKLTALARMSLGVFFAASPLAASAHAKPALHRAASAPAAPTATAPSPALAAVQQFLAVRLTQPDRAYALLSAETQAQFPADGRDQLLRSVTDPASASLPPALLPVVALFADTRDTLHFKFRALGVSPDDPAIVLVRAYQVGTPLSTVSVLKVVTGADSEGGPLRINGLKTAVLAAPELMQGRAADMKAASQSNLKQLALGIMQYAQDHDDKLPDADRWATEIQPYVTSPYIKADKVFQDPAMLGGKWGYAYNRTLSGVSLSDLDDPAATVLLFESTAGRKNAADAGESLPPVGRHSGGTNYAFADGHIQWRSDGSRPSFALTGK